jgi:outer membrane protein assembly factor BamD
MRPIRLPPASAAPLLALALAACGGGELDLTDDERPAEAIFAEAEERLADGDAAAAAALYDDVERLYPYSRLARDAVLRSAEAYYRAGEFEEARLAAERFLTFYPADPAAAEAQYIIALSHYVQIVDTGRDQGETREALAALRETVNRYPDAEVARDAALKLDLTLDHLAGKEMEVGRWYLKRDHYVAAINRFRRVVEEFQTTSHTAEALYRLVEANLALGLEGEARRAAAVLGHNFPGSDYYQRAYALVGGEDPSSGGGGGLGRIYRQVIKGEWL